MDLCGAVIRDVWEADRPGLMGQMIPKRSHGATVNFFLFDLWVSFQLVAVANHVR